MSRNQKILIATALCFFLVAVLWIWKIAPQLTKLPKDFSYRADILSLDNFYDETTQQYSGEKRSVTKFSYEVAGQKQGNLIIKNVFDVRTMSGAKIFSVERLYGIDAFTGAHVPGFGDKNRDGYLFAPRNLKKGEPFTYWHINYDGPAHMTFVEEENLFGLAVYHYETRYEGVKIDQTKNLTNLPGVGVTRGIELEPHLELWIEPKTGRMIKYQDQTIAYYYDLKTGERLHPWNKFTNTQTGEIVAETVEIVKNQRYKFILVETIIPAVLGLIAIIILLFGLSRRRPKILLASIFIIALGLFGVINFWFSQKQTQKYTGPVEKFTLAVINGIEWGSPLYIVNNQQGYFLKNGLEPNIQYYEAGKLALEALIGGKADLATVADAAFMPKTFDNPDLRILTTIEVTNDMVRLVVRKDSGIIQPANLKGKRIGVTKNTIADFFLSNFLLLYNLSIADVIIVDLLPSQMEEAITKGSIDAVSTWEPHAHNIVSALGNNSVVWLEQTNKDSYFLIVGKEKWIDAHPALVKRFLSTLQNGEEYIKENDKQVKELAVKHFNITEPYADFIWPKIKFELSLPQALILALEDLARWSIENKLTDKTEVPNYLNYIYFYALESVKPEAVTIIH